MSDTTPTGFTTERWREFVNQGRQLVQRENDHAWAWGDVAHEYAPANETSANTGGVLERWAEEIGYEGEISTLRGRRALQPRGRLLYV